MANSNKNIVITPNIGSATADPKIVFSGADASTAAQNITMTVYPTNNGTLSIDGSVGQLFSVTNSLSGTLFSVNDISGMPSLEVLDTGDIKLAQYGGDVVIGAASTSGKFAVASTTSVGNAITSWSTGYSLFGPNVASANGAALGVGYNTTLGQSEIASLQAGVVWKPLAVYSSGMIFYTSNGTEGARIDSAGNLTIGASSIDITQAGRGYIGVSGSQEGHISLAVSGVTSTYLRGTPANGVLATIPGIPLIFQTGSQERMRITGTGDVGIGMTPGFSIRLEVSGNTRVSGGVLSSHPTTGIGYSSGTSDYVTQSGSRSSSVTINSICGNINLVPGVGSTTPTTFTVINSSIKYTDTVILNVSASANVYATFVTAVTTGTFAVTIYSLSGTATDSPLLNYAIIRAGSVL